LPALSTATPAHSAALRRSTNQSPKPPRKKVVKNVVLPAPDLTPAQAQQRLNAMTRAEHERCTAYLKHGSFKEAARALDCDQVTVSRTWKVYSALIGIILEEFKAPN